MLTTLVMIASLVEPALVTPPATIPGDRPRVEVWTNRGDDPYHSGQGARVFLRADRDAYVTLFRVDTDGRVRVLFPRDPWEDNFVRGGREFEVTGIRSDEAFEIDDYPGVGYVFAVAAADPFDFDQITSGDHWDYRVITDGRLRGDPYVAMTDLAQDILPADYSDWDYDLVPYYVEQHYDYPRFLCYDCHTYASYAYWNPYAYSCVRFRIVVYDDPYYYPYRYYGGRRAVFVRPLRPEPRFIFKDRGGVGDDRFVTRVRQRPVNDDRRRGVGSRDVGGRGSVPAPKPRARRPDDRQDGQRPVEPRRPRQQQDRQNRRERPQHDPRPQPDRRPDPPPTPRPNRDTGRQEPQRRPAQPARTWGQRPAQPPVQRPEPRRQPPRVEPRRGPAPSAKKPAPSARKPAQRKPELRRRRP
jgi:Domain of unknown function (DUF4384)